MAFKFIPKDRAPDPIDQWVIDRLTDPKPITWDEWQTFRMNSYEQEALFMHLDTDALIKLSRYFVENCGRRERWPAGSYNEAVIHILVPLLLERLEKEAS